MTQTRYLEVVVGFLLSGLSFVEPVRARSPIVTILISDDSGAQAFGSGFVSSPVGDVITCYHVVEGASAVRVLYEDHLYDAEVRSISPERDIAKLRMKGIPLPTRYLRIRPDLPDQLRSQPLFVEGFAAGLFDQRIEAHATQNTFALTGQLKGLHYEKLFEVPGVKIIPLVITVFKGMSGAPLMTRTGEVLGIISGSLTQGGTYGWAISLAEGVSENLMAVNAPRQGFIWPRLKLMASGWDTLRKLSILGQDLTAKIENYEKGLYRLELYRKKTCSGFEIPEARVTDILRILETYPQFADTKLTELRLTAEGQRLDKQLALDKQELADAVVAWAKTRDQYDDALEGSSGELGQLVVAFDKHAASLPRTQRNAELRAQIGRQLTVIKQTTGGLLTRFSELDKSRPDVPIPRTIAETKAEVLGFRSDLLISEKQYCSVSADFGISFTAIAQSTKLLLSADTD